MLLHQTVHYLIRDHRLVVGATLPEEDDGLDAPIDTSGAS